MDERYLVFDIRPKRKVIPMAATIRPTPAREVFSPFDNVLPVEGATGVGLG